MNKCAKVLKGYSNTNYKNINQFLLMDEDEDMFKKKFKKDVNEVKQNIQQLDECFKNTTITDKDTPFVYRGMDKNINLQKGESMLIKNYLSTSRQYENRTC